MSLARIGTGGFSLGHADGPALSGAFCHPASRWNMPLTQKVGRKNVVYVEKSDGKV